MPDRAALIEPALGAGPPARWFRAPGRVNLMGDHTDYNEGFVLPLAIDRDCLVAARPRSDSRVRLRSIDVEPGRDTVEVAADGSDEPSLVEPRWGRLVAGVVRTLAEAGRASVGIDAVLSSTVPEGSGLSSSAAFEVACALALCDAAGLELSTHEVAAACQRAELISTGMPCGIMDQLVALAGVEGSALLIDCRSLSTTPIPLPSNLDIVAVHSGLPRQLTGSAYAERRAGCEAAAQRLGLRALRDADLDLVADDPFARHVVTENERTLETAQALAAGDLDALGRLLAASHASLRDDFRVSTPELDALVRELVAAGAVGARLTGAGFGGCVVALTERKKRQAVVESATTRYRAETGREPTAFVCHAVAGAGKISPPTSVAARQ